MKVEQSSVALSAAHDFTSDTQFSYESELSFRTLYGLAQAAETTAEEAASAEKKLQLMIQQFAQQLIQMLFGESAGTPSKVRELVCDSDAASAGDSGGERGILSFDWTTRTTETVTEHESLSFSAQGRVCTADGRSVEFDFDLSLCRDYSSTREQTLSGTTSLRDPLVLNFEGKACELSGKRFAFDIDQDGVRDSVPALAASSAFLVLDRGQDGIIADGGELFGTQSGDGFADLAAFDEDGNGWIDEADPVYDALRLWRPAGDGEATLSDLRSAGVGAINLESARGSYDLKDANNQLQARIRSSGIYLQESGGAGSLQQVDLSV